MEDSTKKDWFEEYMAMNKKVENLEVQIDALLDLISQMSGLLNLIIKQRSK